MQQKYSNSPRHSIVRHFFFSESAGSDFIYGNPIRRMEDGARGWTGGRAPVGGRWVVGWGGGGCFNGWQGESKEQLLPLLAAVRQPDRQTKKERDY